MEAPDDGSRCHQECGVCHSFHNPLAKDSHMAKPNVNVMRSIVCPKEEAL